MVDLFAVKRDYPTMCFDAVAAFSQADEQELVFLHPPEEYARMAGKPIFWQCLKVREGRRNGARSWQEHFLEQITSSSCPGKFKQNLKTPSLYFSAELDVVIDLHVDDGYCSGPPEALKKVFTYLETVIVMKLSPLATAGMAFDHVGARRERTTAGMCVIPFAKCTESVLEMMGMQGCNGSTSPKLDKKDMDGDREPCENPSLFRSAVCTVLYLAERRPDLQATVRWLCKRLKSWRQLVKMVRYMKRRRPCHCLSEGWRGDFHRRLLGRRLGLRRLGREAVAVAGASGQGGILPEEVAESR